MLLEHKTLLGDSIIRALGLYSTTMSQAYNTASISER